MLKLSEKDAEIRYLSNDAFFWLKDDEDPIDEENLEEAYELMEMFPSGFKLLDKFTYEDADTIKATLVPYIEVPDEDWDGAIEITKYTTIKFRYLPNQEVSVLWLNEQNHKVIDEGTYQISINQFGKSFFTTRLGSKIPLEGSQVVLY